MSILIINMSFINKLVESKGETGERGERGERGETGSRGIIGITGNTGPQGTNAGNNPTFETVDVEFLNCGNSQWK